MWFRWLFTLASRSLLLDRWLPKENQNSLISLFGMFLHRRCWQDLTISTEERLGSWSFHLMETNFSRLERMSRIRWRSMTGLTSVSFANLPWTQTRYLTLAGKTRPSSSLVESNMSNSSPWMVLTWRWTEVSMARLVSPLQYVLVMPSQIKCFSLVDPLVNFTFGREGL